MAGLSATILGCEGPRLSPDEARFFSEAQPWGFILFGSRQPGAVTGYFANLVQPGQ